MRRNEEYQEQVALIQWWAFYSAKNGIPETLLFSLQNGARTNMGTAIKLKKSGGRPGVPDLLLAMPSRVFHGLFIEMKKSKGGVVSKEQKELADLLKWQGYCVEVSHGWAEAVAHIEWYLNG
jgi:hypothetical protein